jgi:Nucleotidyl transferase AbiEii toxin, Type IV TA system
MRRRSDGPPRNLRSLADRIRNEARREGALEARVQRRLAALVVAEMLARANLGTQGPPMLVKGGRALELRLGLGASRSSKDLDAVIRGSMATFMTEASRVVQHPLAGFIGKVVKVREVNVPGMSVKPRAFEVKLSFEGQPFATVSVEVSPPEGLAATEYDDVSSPTLEGLGMDDLPPVPCLSVRYQVAQKLHACTDPLSEGRVNDRARDLVDILLLEPLLDTDLAMVKAACLDVFIVRDRHVWPPTLVVHGTWPAIYATAAIGLENLVPVDVHQAAETIRELIASIDAA